MSKKLTVKIKHHYVSREHLRYWSADRKNIFYTTSKGNLACDGIAGLAMEKHFYQISTIDDRDESFIRTFCINDSSYELKKTNEDDLELFLNISKILEFSKKSKLETSKIIENNFLEDLYGSHERDVYQIQKKLCQEQTELLDDNQELLKLYHYIAHQSLKTRIIRDRLISNFSKNKENNTFKNSSIVYLVKKNWWAMSYLFGNNLAFNLFSSDYKLTLLRNFSEEPFITSDQAVHNIHTSTKNSDDTTPPEGMTYYFPISPNYALHIGTDENLGGGILEISSIQAEEFNSLVAGDMYYHLFATSKDQLKRISKKKKTHK
ncbi:DUF4238 domain-containing protein [Marinomonas gallaica]|uniref:DUF4238 domain-containing protein n=1 Tax=Marinomonas gallaica TaxID=1806667 RepID=UPI003A900AC5